MLNAGSIYIGEQPLISGIDWQWPVRIGLLNAEAEQAYASIGQSSTISQLTVPMVIRKQKGVVDLLWIPQDVSSALTELENAPFPIHAHAVAITGGSGDLDWSAIEQAKNRIRELTQAQAIAVTSSDSGWLRNFITDLSHDATFDVAAFRSAGGVLNQAPAPLLWSSEPLIEGSSVKRFSRDMIKTGLNKLGPEWPLRLNDYVTSELNLPRGLNPAPQVLTALGSQLEELDWRHESGGASIVAEISRAIEHATPARKLPLGVSQFTRPIRIPSETLPSDGPRYLQTEVFAEIPDGKATRLKEAFVAGLRHSLQVHIGPDLKDDDHLVLGDAFPENELPPSPNGHLLVVTFFEPQLMEEPQVQTLFLPQSGGSTRCGFRFVVESQVKEIEGRITVLHENRVLQTGLVRGPVVSSVGESVDSHSASQKVIREADALMRITFALSGSVRRAIADLDQRSRFDAALVLNHLKGQPGVQAIAGNRAAYLSLSDAVVTGAKEAIDKALDSGDWDYKEYDGLFASGTTELLRLLAIKGSDLYVYVTRFFPVPVMRAPRLQVVMAREGSRFPFDFFYEFNAPASNAPVCPHAEEALRTGSCAKDCKSKDEVPAAVVCPLGFWGLSRVLEWHAFSPEAASDLPQYAAGKIDIDIAPRSEEVRLGGPSLFGYSKEIEKAEKGSITGFTERASKRPGAPVMVESWTDWRDRVQELNPSLLMLLVHTKTDKYGTLLEMGPPTPSHSVEDSLLGISYITRDYVMGRGVTGSPIVLLLGCTTARATLPFETVASAFEARANAGIIVATSNLIYGPKAVRVAEVFLEKLREVGEDESFGDVMLRVRRSALADGIAMILCISAYGDADWKLVRQEV